MKKPPVKEEFLNIFRRIRKKDFKGNEGLVIKNSLYESSKSFIGKIGGFIFTILIARFLAPELFGLYNLAISTIFMFITFTDLGINTAVIRYLSKYLPTKKKKKAGSYLSYFIKTKLSVIAIILAILALSSKFIAVDYYGKPIFLALLAGILYVFFFSLNEFTNAIFYSLNKFKWVFYKNIVLQALRIVVIISIILFVINYSISKEISLFLIVLFLAISYAILLIFSLFLIKKKTNLLKIKKQAISYREKKEIKKFILPLSAIALSGMFFGRIDTIILGRFVAAEFLGYYGAAFMLIVAIASIVNFSVVLLPVFTRLKGKQLEEGLKKTVKTVFFFSLLIWIFTFAFSPIIIRIVFGSEYLISLNTFRIFSLLLISSPLSQIYTTYFISKGRTKIVARLIIISTFMNIILDYLLISWLINISQGLAIEGVAIASLASRYFLIGALMFFKKRT